MYGFIAVSLTDLARGERNMSTTFVGKAYHPIFAMPPPHMIRSNLDQAVGGSLSDAPDRSI